jgi:hypothetical protein
MPDIPCECIAGTYVDKAYGEIVIYPVNQANIPRLPQACQELVEAEPSLFAEAATIPTLIAHFPKFRSTHLVFTHRTGSTFTVHSRTTSAETGVTTISTMPSYDAVFTADGMALTRGAWQAGVGVEPRELREDDMRGSAEVWFDKR